MKRTDKSALAAHLAALGVEPGRNVVVHSNLAAFGILDGGAEGLWKCLCEIAGDRATIVVPSYRLTAPAEEIFDRANSPSLSVGAFSEYVRRRPEAVRSANPLHSHCFVGPLASEFINDVPRPSFGHDSDFEFLERHGFLCLMLGCDLENAGTLVFHSQACAGTIPYRSWQTLRRMCILNGEAEAKPYDFAYYARVPGAPRETRRELQRRMLEAGLLRSAPAAYGKSLSLACGAANRFLTQLFRTEPMICAPQPSGST
jgi:aminoglycoside 3-N-acetyltransferase